MAATYDTSSHRAKVTIRTYNQWGEACLLTLTASVNATSRAYPVLLPAAAHGLPAVYPVLFTTGDQAT